MEATVSTSSSPPITASSFPPDPEMDGGEATERSLVTAHFADAGGGERDTQVVDLSTPGRRATLTMVRGKPTSEARPFLVIADDGGRKVLWSRERPVAGIMAPVGPIAIAGGPNDRVALAACDPPTHVIALRIWDADGAPFADFQAMSNETCEAIALLYWPHHGWVIAIAREGATRAQLVKETGSLAWSGGIDVGVRSRPGALAPPALANDTNDTFVLVQLAQPSGEPGSPFHAMAFRYDAEGTAIWPRAVSLPLKSGAAGQRVVLHSHGAGVSVDLPDRKVMITPSGATKLLQN